MANGICLCCGQALPLTQSDETVTQFVEAMLRPSTGASVAWRDLYQAYQTYCERSGLEIKSETLVAKVLKTLGFRKRHTRKGKIYLNIGLVTQYFSKDKIASPRVTE